MTKTQTTLPRITRFDGVTDSGEFGATCCPHCGADGRYMYRFLTDDGPRGAMAGCIKLFPVSPIANEHKKLLDKQKNGDSLNGWDTKKLEAIEAFYRGEIEEWQAQNEITTQNNARDAWIKRKYRR